MSLELRTGTRDDVPALYDLTVEAFGFPADSPRLPPLRGIIETHPEDYRVLWRDGEMVAALHIGDVWIQVGECAVLKGDVGHVAVRKDLQGEGIGTALMQQTMIWMSDRGYHMSRLGGLMHFYSRFGYEPFLRRFVEFHVTDMQGGAMRIPAREAFCTPDASPGSIRPFDEARDWEARARLAYEFDRGRSGVAKVNASATPPSSPAPPDPNGLALVYERDGQVRGFAFASHSEIESTEVQEHYNLGGFAYDPAFPETPSLLLRSLFARIAGDRPVLVNSRLPFDDRLAVDLHRGGVSFQRVELHQRVAGNMIRLFDTGAIIEQIVPELSRRISDSLFADWAGVVQLSLPSGVAQFAVRDGAVSRCEGAGADVSLEMTQADFVKLLFGINGFGELPCSHGLDIGPREHAVIQTLFPRCQTGSGPWG